MTYRCRGCSEAASAKHVGVPVCSDCRWRIQRIAAAIVLELEESQPDPR